jgi:hypothetical protein
LPKVSLTSSYPARMTTSMDPTMPNTKDDLQNPDSDRDGQSSQRSHTHLASRANASTAYRRHLHWRSWELNLG